MDELVMWAIGLIALGVALKICRIVREIILTALYIFELIIAIRFVLKLVATPIFRSLTAVCKKMSAWFRMLCRLIDGHCQYRKVQAIHPEGCIGIHNENNS